MKLHGNLTWGDYAPTDVIGTDRKKDRIILMTFPEASSSLGLEPSVLSIGATGDKVEYSYKNRDFNDDDVNTYLCSVYISGVVEFEQWTRKHNFNKIVVGGYHPTTFPEEFIKLAHKIVQGPTDDIWLTLAQPAQVVPGIVTYKNLPRRDIYDLDYNQQIIPDKKRTDRVVSINTSQGCSTTPPCDFCASPIMCSQVLSKPLEYVEREVKQLSNFYPRFCFIRDENFFMQRDWKERLQILRKLGRNINYPLSYYLFASSNTLNEKRVQAMKDAGVYMVCIGLEDPTKEYAKNKKLNRTCALLKDYGIYKYLSFIVNPLEIIGAEKGEEYYKCLMNRLYELKPEMICGNFLMPFPGTALWDKYYAYVSRDDYKYYDSKTPFMIRNEVLREKMKFFLFWYQWKYYTSDFYNQQVRDFRGPFMDEYDTLYIRFKELRDQFMEKYETIWNVRA